MKDMHKQLAQSVMAYDMAITFCAGDPIVMGEYRNENGDTIADIYFRMLEQARFVLSQPNMLVAPVINDMMTKWKHNNEGND
jgi:hypothetical protein